MLSAQKHFSFISKTHDHVAIKVMQLLHDAGQSLSILEVASALSIDISLIQYCFDLLIENDFIVQTKAGFEHSWTERDFPDLYVLTSRGRQFLCQSEAK